MVGRKHAAYALGVLSALCLGVATLLGFMPPAPDDCGIDKYCEEAAYDRILDAIYGLWALTGITLMAGLSLYVSHLVTPPEPEPAPTSDEAKPTGPPESVHVLPDGRRIVATKAATDPRGRGRKG